MKNINLYVFLVICVLGEYLSGKKDTPTTADSAAVALRCQDGKIYMYEGGKFVCVAFCPYFKGQD